MAIAVPPNIDNTQHGVIGIDPVPYDITKRILALSGTHKHSDGRVKQSGSYQKVVNIREVDTYVIHEKETWLDEFLVSTAVHANQTFNYNISGLLERPQLLRYRAPSNGYNWHTDLGVGDASTRKISITILLNGAFTGGEFITFSEGEHHIPINPCEGIAFSSFIPHKVNKVTKGERWALVAWIAGPSFV